MREDLPEEFKSLYEDGEALQQRIKDHLAQAPKQQDGAYPEIEKCDRSVRDRAEELIKETERWVNSIKAFVLPHVLTITEHDATILLHELKWLIHLQYAPEKAPQPLSTAFGTMLRIIETAPSPMPSQTHSAQGLTTAHTPNTAFILMWMDPKHKALVDVCNAIKDVFAEFGVTASRADDVEHQDVITTLVLNKIAGSEFLIADLTGERPNVYYEVGYAHALEKRPILIRKKGTQLHFDIAGYNVIEYKNHTELKRSLERRLEAMTGRNPPNR